MKRLIVISALCLLTTISCICQNTYPQKLVVGNDTLVALTPGQVKSINLLLNDRLMYRDIVQETRLKIDSINKVIMNVNLLSKEKSMLIDLQYKQIIDLNKLYGFASQNIDILKGEVKDQKRKKFKSTVVSIAGTALVTASAVLLLK